MHFSHYYKVKSEADKDLIIHTFNYLNVRMDSKSLKEAVVFNIVNNRRYKSILWIYDNNNWNSDFQGEKDYAIFFESLDSFINKSRQKMIKNKLVN